MIPFETSDHEQVYWTHHHTLWDHLDDYYHHWCAFDALRSSRLDENQGEIGGEAGHYLSLDSAASSPLAAAAGHMSSNSIMKPVQVVDDDEDVDFGVDPAGSRGSGRCGQNWMRSVCCCCCYYCCCYCCYCSLL